MLLNCCLDRAGYDGEEIPGSSEKITSNPKASDCTIGRMDLDENLDQGVANKVSSAHIGAFQSSASVILRSVLKELDDQDPIRANSSAAADLACRLLGCPAVKIARKDMDFFCECNDILHVFLPLDESKESTTVTFGSAFYGGGPLAIGDAFACYGSDDDTDKQNGALNFIAFDP